MNIRAKFETNRLIIRQVTSEDSTSIWEIWKNPDNEKYMGDPVSSLQEVKSICKSIQVNPSDKSSLRVAILRDTNEIVGTCCFGYTKVGMQWGFGYSIHPNMWGNGYSTELVKGIIDFGKKLNITSFTSSCASENIASKKVLEKCNLKLTDKSSFLQPILNITYEEDIYELIIL